jgi:3-dehydroquinate dehydratase type I
MICIPLGRIGFDDCMAMVRKEAFVEFRFDLLALTLEQVREVVREALSCVATCRPGNIDESRRLEILQTAVQAGADYVDIELEADPAFRSAIIRMARKHSTRVIVSYHNFDLTPTLPELKEIVNGCTEAGADVVKVASQVNHPRDLQDLFKLYSQDQRMVIIGMGQKGIISRVAAPLLGAEFTFAAPAAGKETAPGQISKDKLLSIIKEIQE